MAQVAFDVVAPQVDWRKDPWSYEACLKSHLDKCGTGCERYKQGDPHCKISETVEGAKCRGFLADCGEYPKVDPMERFDSYAVMADVGQLLQSGTLSDANRPVPVNVLEEQTRGGQTDSVQKYQRMIQTGSKKK